MSAPAPVKASVASSSGPKPGFAAPAKPAHLSREQQQRAALLRQKLSAVSAADIALAAQNKPLAAVSKKASKPAAANKFVAADGLSDLEDDDDVDDDGSTAKRVSHRSFLENDVSDDDDDLPAFIAPSSNKKAAAKTAAAIKPKTETAAPASSSNKRAAPGKSESKSNDDGAFKWGFNDDDDDTTLMLDTDDYRNDDDDGGADLTGSLLLGDNDDDDNGFGVNHRAKKASLSELAAQQKAAKAQAKADEQAKSKTARNKEAAIAAGVHADPSLKHFRAPLSIPTIAEAKAFFTDELTATAYAASSLAPSVTSVLTVAKNLAAQRQLPPPVEGVPPFPIFMGPVTGWRSQAKLAVRVYGETAAALANKKAEADAFTKKLAAARAAASATGGKVNTKGAVHLSRKEAKLAAKLERGETLWEAPAIGLFEPGTHKIVPGIKTCPAHATGVNAAIAEVEAAVHATEVEGFNDTTGAGNLRYVAMQIVQHPLMPSEAARVYQLEQDRLAAHSAKTAAASANKDGSKDSSKDSAKDAAAATAAAASVAKPPPVSSGLCARRGTVQLTLVWNSMGADCDKPASFDTPAIQEQCSEGSKGLAEIETREPKLAALIRRLLASRPGGAVAGGSGSGNGGGLSKKAKAKAAKAKAEAEAKAKEEAGAKTEAKDGDNNKSAAATKTGAANAKTESKAAVKTEADAAKAAKAEDEEDDGTHWLWHSIWVHYNNAWSHTNAIFSRDDKAWQRVWGPKEIIETMPVPTIAVREAATVGVRGLNAEAPSVLRAQAKAEQTLSQVENPNNVAPGHHGQSSKPGKPAHAASGATDAGAAGAGFKGKEPELKLSRYEAVVSNLEKAGKIKTNGTAANMTDAEFSKKITFAGNDNNKNTPTVTAAAAGSVPVAAKKVVFGAATDSANKDDASSGSKKIMLLPSSVSNNTMTASEMALSVAISVQAPVTSMPCLRFPPTVFRQANVDGFATIIGSIKPFLPPHARVVELYGGVGTIGLHLVDQVEYLVCSDENPYNARCFRATVGSLPAATKAGRALKYISKNANDMVKAGALSNSMATVGEVFPRPATMAAGESGAKKAKKGKGPIMAPACSGVPIPANADRKDPLPPPNVCLVDPPRKGLDEDVLVALSGPKLAPGASYSSAAATNSAKNSKSCGAGAAAATVGGAPANALTRLIYVSCGFKALQRDCARLLAPGGGGWKIAHAEGHVLFPGADHLETLVIFVR